MNIFLIVLAVIIVVVVGLILSGRQRGKKPYTLDSLSKEELMWLLTAYDAAISPETGTFRGGGVWRSEASFAQKDLQAALIMGRLDEAQLEMLINFVNRANNSTSDPLVDEVLKKLERIRYSGNSSRGTGAVV